MISTMTLVGMDGLSTDETVSRYYWDGNQLYLELWGNPLLVDLEIAIANTKNSIGIYKKLEWMDDTDRQRQSACERLLEELIKLR